MLHYIQYKMTVHAGIHNHKNGCSMLELNNVVFCICRC